MVKAHWIPLTAVSLTTALFWYLVIVTGLVGGCSPGGQSPDIAGYPEVETGDFWSADGRNHVRHLQKKMAALEAEVSEHDERLDKLEKCVKP